MIAERYFERRQIQEAIEFAMAGGIAVHRNLDSYDGRQSPRGFVMRKPFLHVIGLRPVLEEWGGRWGLRPEWIQPEKRREVAHYDVFGEFAQRLIDRLTSARGDIAEEFRRFGAVRSPLYALLSPAVAGDPQLLQLASKATAGQPGPNLLYAAVHYLLLRGAYHPLSEYYRSVGGTRAPDSSAFEAFRDFCRRHSAAIGRLVRERRVQTNEVQRSASLLPGFQVVFSRTARPLALIEVGASAGLNLNFDLYEYDFGPAGRIGSPGEVKLRPDVRGELAPPLGGGGRFPEIAFRAGIDLRPVDIRDPDQTLWLEALVWPDQTWRRDLLRSAIRVSKGRPPRLVAGDVLDALPALLDAVPAEAALVVYHTYAIYQLSSAGRRRFTDLLAVESVRRDVFRLAIEWYESSRPLLELTAWRAGERTTTILAACGEHGQWIQWLDASTASTSLCG